MIVVARIPRRLPGFRFAVQSPSLANVLPRMDIATFVGFASQGPLHTPVAVEDVAHFESIFGADVPLGWDKGRGEVAYGHLGATVRAFFRNGGRRCWIIRVAGAARANLFPIPGLLQLGDNGTPAPAFAQARSEGSWSDRLRVSATLQSRPLDVRAVMLPALTVDLAPVVPGAVVPGDLLRLTFRDPGYELLLVVGTITTLTTGGQGASLILPARPERGLGEAGVVRVTGRLALWFSKRPPATLPPGPITARMFVQEPATPQPPTLSFAGPPIPVLDAPVVGDPATVGADKTIRLTLGIGLPEAPLPGAVLRVDYAGGEQLWLTVLAVRLPEATGSPLMEGVEVLGQGRWWLPQPPTDLPPTAPPDQGEHLSFTLWVREEDGYPTPLPDLAFAPGQPAFWATLPTDIQLYAPPDSGAAPAPPDLWRAVTHPRFPLAGSDSPAPVYVPAGMPFLLDAFLPPLRLRADARQRDGLGEYGPGLFLDPALIETRTGDLTAQADYLRYQSPAPRRLTGIHAALGVEETTLIAVPDAAGRGWYRPQPEALRLPEESDPLPHPAWWHFLSCMPRPRLFTRDTLDQVPTFTLAWARHADPAARYTLQEATHPDFTNPMIVYSGPAAEHTPCGQQPGVYYYRVRVTAANDTSEWSNALGVRVTPGRWQLIAPAEAYTPVPLAAEPPWGEFLACGLHIIAPPLLQADCPGEQAGVTQLGPGCTATEHGMYVLRWTPSLDPAARYILQEALTPNFSDAIILYTGAVPRRELYGRTPGDYYYRVRVEEGADSSDWSNGVVVRVERAGRWLLDEPENYDRRGLLAVQRALLRMCAARGDLFAVLGLPEHYQDAAALQYIATLKSPFADPVPVGAGSVAPLGFGEAAAFSYGAVYHPWLVESGDAPPVMFRRTPPEGAACGVLALRAVTRGAWIAPANELLRQVVALTPAIGHDHWLALLEAQINVVRQEPRGFLMLSADTLSDDGALRPIGVRRLLILLRRLALRLGATYVFEPNSDAFQRMVQRGFESLLGLMFARGAFAGATAAASFQVVVTTTPHDQDTGRFIVELRVAPSLPLAFLTIRLVQAGDRALLTEEL